MLTQEMHREAVSEDAVLRDWSSPSRIRDLRVALTLRLDTSPTDMRARAGPRLE